MKSIALVALAAAFLMATAASARTVTNTPRTANEQSVNGVAGPPPSKRVASTEDKSSMHPGKKVHKKIKVTPPPAVRD